jgi:hypothetical protein
VEVSTLLVEPEGAIAFSRSDPRPGPGRWHWVAATVLGILAAALLAVGESGGIDLSLFSERRLIQGYLDAWYGGDFEAATGLRQPDRLRTGPSEERSRGEVEYQALLGAQVEVLACEELPPKTIRCEVSYSNRLTETLGAEPAVVAQQFGLQDGRIAFVAGPYLHDERLTASFGRFATELFPAEYEEGCIEEPNYQPPGCARFKLAHLDEWVAWHRMGPTRSQLP